MNANRSAKSWMTALVAVAFAFLAGAATAEIVTTEEALQRSDRERVGEVLNYEGAQERLKAMGVAPEEVRRRVDAMTPEEAQLVASKIDTLAAGGALGQNDWILIALIVIIVLLIV